MNVLHLLQRMPGFNNRAVLDLRVSSFGLQTAVRQREADDVDVVMYIPLIMHTTVMKR